MEVFLHQQLIIIEDLIIIEPKTFLKRNPFLFDEPSQVFMFFTTFVKPVCPFCPELFGPFDELVLLVVLAPTFLTKSVIRLQLFFLPVCAPPLLS